MPIVEPGGSALLRDPPPLNRHFRPSGCSATAAVRASRQAARRFASAASLVARIAAASSPALVAPALPMASVPTGTPAGICTME